LDIYRLSNIPEATSQIPVNEEEQEPFEQLLARESEEDNPLLKISKIKEKYKL